jgi:hypothetical protein
MYLCMSFPVCSQKGVEQGRERVMVGEHKGEAPREGWKRRDFPPGEGPRTFFLHPTPPPIPYFLPMLGLKLCGREGVRVGKVFAKAQAWP